MADRFMQCPQCGGELVILDDGKRQCQSCQMKYMLASRARAATPAAEEENGEPVTDQYNQCPRCGGELVMLSDGKRKCQSCGMKYVLMPRSASGRAFAPAGISDEYGGGGYVGASAASGKKKKKSSGVAAVLIAAALLLTAAGGFVAYRYFFADDSEDLPAANKVVESDISYPDTEYVAEEYEAFRNIWWVDFLPASALFDFIKGDGDFSEGNLYSFPERYWEHRLEIYGVVTEVADDYFVVNGVSCYFHPDLLTEEELGSIRALKVNDSVSVRGYLCNTTPDAVRMKYCVVTRHVPGSVFTLQDFLGDWDDSVSKRCGMAIEQIDSETISVEVDWSSSATENTTWSMTAKYDPDRHAFAYTDCVKSRSYQAADGSATEETEYDAGSGCFSVRDGLLYWTDDEERIRDGCAFINFAKDPNRAEPVDYVSLPVEEQIAYLSSVLGDADYVSMGEPYEAGFGPFIEAHCAGFGENGLNDIWWILLADGTVWQYGTGFNILVPVN